MTRRQRTWSTLARSASEGESPSILARPSLALRASVAAEDVAAAAFLGPRSICAGVLATAAILWSTIASAEDLGQGAVPDKVSLTRHVLPLLARHGCGRCHDSRTVPQVFGLSLFGSRPDEDREQLVRHNHGRLVDRIEPAKSLLLLRGTEQLPHTGGNYDVLLRQRFGAVVYGHMDRGSFAQVVLQRWIAQG